MALKPWHDSLLGHGGGLGNVGFFPTTTLLGLVYHGGAGCLHKAPALSLNSEDGHFAVLRRLERCEGDGD